MEELGIKPKRVAGASAGAICAALLAAGYNTEELKKVLARDLDEILMGKIYDCKVVFKIR